MEKLFEKVVAIPSNDHICTKIEHISHVESISHTLDLNKKNKKIGFTIGKYAPLHKGHQLLLEKALKEMDEFYCVIYDTDIIDIDVRQRAEWVKKLYPNIKIIYAYDSPKQYGLDDESVKIQMDYLVNLIKDIPVTHFYSSEPYGEKVAEYLKIKNVVVDIDRIKVPIKSTKIRDDIENNKKYIEEFVYNDLKKNLNNSEK